MRTSRTIADLRAALREPRAAGRTIGLVPTMGAFHAGHLALIAAARAACEVVVVSLFVNPAQFRPGEDFAAYPRDEEGDLALAERAGVDVLFAPSAAEMYPPGFSTTVHVSGLSEPLEGTVRGPEHFTGVTTVVLKLLNAVGPDVAFFGQKDAQQAAVVRRMVRDLDVPTRISVQPTVREPDGLAMSSRNRYLESEDRRRAVGLRRGLEAAERAAAGGERAAERLRAAALAAMAPYDVEPEYLELVSPETLERVARVQAPALMAVAARVGPARLIDNTIIDPDGSP